MKATIDLDEALYRRLKVEAARRGRTVRELVAEGIRAVIDSPDLGAAPRNDTPSAQWFGTLNAYAANADQHDLGAMRASIARGRGKSSK
ncbi:MAG: hypothetical protein M3Z05_14120 [Gemmatimonadota bacterium]|nr:hypothetical protein [Gemmatimonadota bacterium]